MGITIEIYVADPEEFVSLQKRIASELTSEEEAQLIFNQLREYPQADFSLHLHWPEDIDALCQAMFAQGLAVPASHTKLLVSLDFPRNFLLLSHRQPRKRSSRLQSNG